MTDADDRLRALFAQDEPPARDPAFSSAVMAEIARRAFLAEMATLSGVTALGGLVLWAVWPVVAPALWIASTMPSVNSPDLNRAVSRAAMSSDRKSVV